MEKLIEKDFKTFLQNVLPIFIINFIRFLRNNIPSKWRAIKRIKLKPLSLEDLKLSLQVAGINNKDTIMVHSSLSKIGNVEGGAMTVVKSLMKIVTQKGTILMPTYGSAQEVENNSKLGKVVDLRTKRSGTGVITETFRKMPGVLRSSHPFSSVCAWGKNDEFLTSGHADAPRICHPNSPLARLVDLGGKVVGIGVSLGPISIYHVIEDTWNGFPFRVYSDPFKATYIDNTGKFITRQVVRYDSGISVTRIDHDRGEWIREKLTHHFAEIGILRFFRFGEAELWVVESRPLYKELKRLAKKGITIYSTKNEIISKGIDINA